MTYHTATLDVLPTARVMKALADETRLRIVALLAHGELCVCHIEVALDLSQSSASRHLTALHQARIVKRRRDATWVYYSLASPGDAQGDKIVRSLIKTFAQDDALRRDIIKLRKACGPAACA